jgi:hypothetical protein
MSDVLTRQGKSAAAESAVKLTVYQNDEVTETPVAPVTQVADTPVADVVDIAEPVLRPSENTNNTQTINNATDVMKKWSVKS